MGCIVSNEAIEADLQHAAPDFDRAADPKKTFYHQTDFSCHFEPQLFGQLFNMNSTIEPSAFSLPLLEEGKDKYEDGYDMFLIRPYKQFPLPQSVAFSLLLGEFKQLTEKDLSNLYKYVYLNKTHPDVFTAKEFIRFAYLCYRFSYICKQPSLSLFYFLDDHQSGYVNSKKLCQIISVHFHCEKPEKTIFHASHSYVSIDEYSDGVAKIKKKYNDELSQIFMYCYQNQYDDLDTSIKSLDTWEMEFSDFSQGKEKEAKIRKLKRRAVELKWSQKDLDDAIERATKTENWDECIEKIDSEEWQ